MRILIALILLFQPPSLHVIPTRDTVYPGQVFTVAVYAFDVVDPVEFDSGGLEVLTDTMELGGTRYVWLRAAGPARDVRVRAWGAGVEASSVIRICCVESPAPVDSTRRVYVAVLRR